MVVEEIVLRVDASRALGALAASVSDLPCFPEVASAVARAAESPEATPQAVATRLATDPALAARTLRLANSPYYGLSGQVADLAEAVVVLGMRSVRNLAMVACGYPQGRRKASSPFEEGARRHALATALASRAVAERTYVASGDVAFTAGLLHSLGRTVLRSGGLRDTGGYDEEQFGERLAQEWGFPQPLTRAIRFHRDPDACEPTCGLVDCVHLAAYLASQLGLEAESLPFPLTEAALVRLRLIRADLPVLTEELRSAFEAHERALAQDTAHPCVA